MNPTPPLERDLEQWLVRYCREHGIYCRKFSSPAHRGVPDRLLIYQGRVLFLELKRKGQTPTALQERELSIIAKHGGTATWADSRSAVERLLHQLMHPEQPSYFPRVYP